MPAFRNNFNASVSDPESKFTNNFYIMYHARYKNSYININIILSKERVWVHAFILSPELFLCVKIYPAGAASPDEQE